MVDAPQKPSSSDSSASEPQLSHLSNLHRMSRTAGLGSSEYTAVNIIAVVAVIVGAASALALMTPVFLFLPVIGVILAAAAIKQIRSSNGTQTGLALAILALALSIGLSGFTGFRYYQAVAQEEQDKHDLDALIGNFGKAIADKKYADAYAMTDPRFRDSVTPAQFENLFTELSAAPTYGPLTGIRSTKLFGIEADAENSDIRMAAGYALLDTQKLSGDSAIRTEIRYRNTDGTWKVYAIPQFFAAKAAPAAGAGGGATGGGAAGGGASPGVAGPPAPR